MAILTFLKALLYPFLLVATTITQFFWPDYPDDNPVEETAEYIIYAETGQSTDLTPNSPEYFDPEYDMTTDGPTRDYYGNK